MRLLAYDSSSLGAWLAAKTKSVEMNDFSASNSTVIRSTCLRAFVFAAFPEARFAACQSGSNGKLSIPSASVRPSF